MMGKVFRYATVCLSVFLPSGIEIEHANAQKKYRKGNWEKKRRGKVRVFQAKKIGENGRF